MKKDYFWLWFTIIISNILLGLTIALISVFTDYTSKLFDTTVNIGVTLVIMFVLEIISTLTFQARILLTSKKDKIKYQWIIPAIACFSWFIASLEGLILINDSDTIIKFVIKFIPVGVATFLGVYCVNFKPKVGSIQAPVQK